MNKEQTTYIYPFPRVVRIEPAGACNLKCSHCPTGTVKMERGIMSRETFDRVLQNIQEHKAFVKVIVLYHGGEPFLNKRFAEMVRQIRAVMQGNDVLVKTVTNGMLLTESASQEIIVAGLDAIEISLDGQSPEENDLIRRNCNYNKVISNVKNLIAIKKRLQSNAPQIFIASTQFFDPQIHYGREDPNPPDYLLAEFSGECENEITGFKTTWALQWPHMEVLDDVFTLYQEEDDQESRNSCDHVESTITIRWDGDVVACCYDLTSQFVLGNIYNDSLLSIFNNPRYIGLRKSIKEGKFIPMCNNCAVVKPKQFLCLKSVNNKVIVKTQQKIVEGGVYD